MFRNYWIPGVESNIHVTFINVLKQQIPTFFSQYVSCSETKENSDFWVKEQMF